MRKQLIWTTVAATLILAEFTQADEHPRTIRVTGEGEATAPPDLATVQTGVVTQASGAKEALAANNTAMEKILTVLKEHEVAPNDVQTSRINVRPLHERSRDGQQHPKIVAYEVTNELQIRVRQLSRLGTVLDALVQAGSNQLSGVSLDVADPKSLLDEARRKAIADARHRAQLYAREAGIRVGKVRSISEQPIRTPQPRYLARGTAEMASSVPVAIGEKEFHVTVEVEFGIEDEK